MPTIHFLNDHKSVDVLPGANLRQAALKAGVGLANPIQRFLRINVKLGPVNIPCTSDVVEIVEGKGVNARTPDEERLIGGRIVKRKVAPSHRLACQVQVTGDITVRTRLSREIDLEETKRHAGYFGALGLFTLIMVLTFAVMGLDLVKLL